MRHAILICIRWTRGAALEVSLKGTAHRFRRPRVDEGMYSYTRLMPLRSFLLDQRDLIATTASGNSGKIHPIPLRRINCGWWMHAEDSSGRDAGETDSDARSPISVTEGGVSPSRCFETRQESLGLNFRSGWQIP